MENNNFNLQNKIESGDISEISGNKVTLKQISAGKTVTIKLPIKAKYEKKIKAEDLNKKTRVVLSGEYIDSNNAENKTSTEVKGKSSVEIDWVSSKNTQAELNAKVLTNYSYTVNEEEKQLVQFLIGSKITNNNYPIKNTEINLNVLENAEDVEVHTRSTDATNGNIKFSKTNYTYNKETRNLKINLANDNLEDVFWNKDGLDLFVVTYVFAKDENILNKEISIGAKINTYDEKEFIANKNLLIDTKKDGIISYSVENSEPSIYKGKIYTGEAREYKETQKIDVDYIGVAENVSLKSNEDFYLNNTITTSANILYKQTKINKQEFIKIFGEDGFITIKNSSGAVIANISSKTKADEQGNIIVDYINNTKNIEILTSKPKHVGTLKIENTKQILNNEYKREEVNTFTSIKSTFTGNYNEKQIENLEKQIELQETTSTAKLEIGTKTLTAENTNENVKIKVVLPNNSEEQDVFSNPNIKITFPKQIANITAKCKVLYGNGLELGNAEIVNNEGIQEIKIGLSGTQESLNPSNIEGTTIIIYANIDVNKDAATTLEDITLNYTNEFATSLENNGEQKVKVKIIEKQKEENIIKQDLPLAKATAQEAQDINGIKMTVTARVGEQELEDGAEVKAGEIIVYNVKLENTTDADVEGLTFTATIPENTTQIEVNPKYPGYDEELEQFTNEEEYFIEKQEKEIRKENIQIRSKENIEYYYMIKVNENLSNSSTEKIENVLNYKENTTKVEQSFSFNPSSLIATIKPLNRTPNEDLNYSYTYKYSLALKNNSNTSQNNIQLTFNKNELINITKFQISSKEKYEILDGDNLTLTIDSLAVNEVIYIIINAKILQAKENNGNAEISATINNDSNIFKVNKISERVVGPRFEMTGYSVANNVKNVLESGNIVKYTFKIKNTGNVQVDEVNIRDYFSNYLKLNTVTINNEQCEYEHIIEDENDEENADNNENYDEKNVISIKKKIEIGEEIILEITGTVTSEIEDNKQYECYNQCFVYYNGIVLAKTDNIRYIIKNEVEDNIDDEQQYVDPDLEDDGLAQNTEEYNQDASNDNQNDNNENNENQNENNNQNDNNENNENQNENNNQNDNNENNENQNENNNQNNNNENNTPNDNQENNDNQNEQADSENSSLSTISGLAWLDKNKNGKRETEEELLNNIYVTLLNLDNNTTEETYTNGDGEYKFENIENGKYVVIFEYDEELYNLTIYQADGVNSLQNSDVELVEMTINGTKKKVASTDTLNIQNSNLENIDIGLVEANVFDLKLTKGISKITVSNTQGTNVQEFENSNLAKVEIKAKYLQGSTVVIEYIIRVENKGEIAGYARQIVDYKPTDLTFNTKLNPDWYQSENNLYNDSLEDKLIKPGETKEIKLILTKQMTEFNTGLTNNIAEIAEDENEKDVEDINSTPGNKNLKENDLGQANAIISVSTGVAFRFFFTTLLITAIIASCGYLISKRIIEKNFNF